MLGLEKEINRRKKSIRKMQNSEFNSLYKKWVESDSSKYDDFFENAYRLILEYKLFGLFSKKLIS